MSAHADAIWELYPDADLNRDTRSLYEGWAARELRVPKCDDCGKWHMPPRSICPFCWSFSVTSRPVSGRGRVHLAINLLQGREAPGVSYPYPVVTVELEEQAALRFTSTIVGQDGIDGVLDLPVQLEWQMREGAPFPVFRAVAGLA